MEQNPGTGTVRERLVETADRLFYREGIHSVGIDRIVAESGVAKSTMYVHFRTKEDLIGEYLRRRSDLMRVRVTAAVEADAERPARERILVVFDVLDQVISGPDFRGCAFVNAAAEYPDHQGIRSAIAYDRQWLPRLFGELLDSADIGDAPAWVEVLVQLYDGANVAAHLDASKNSAGTARETVARVLAIADPRG